MCNPSSDPPSEDDTAGEGGMTSRNMPHLIPLDMPATDGLPYNLPFRKIATSSQMPIMAAARKPMIPIRDIP